MLLLYQSLKPEAQIHTDAQQTSITHVKACLLQFIVFYNSETFSFFFDMDAMERAHWTFIHVATYWFTFLYVFRSKQSFNDLGSYRLYCIQTNIIPGWIFPDGFWKFIMQLIAAFKYAVKAFPFKERARHKERPETLAKLIWTGPILWGKVCCSMTSPHVTCFWGNGPRLWLHICESVINARRYRKVWEQHMLTSRCFGIRMNFQMYGPGSTV